MNTSYTTPELKAADRAMKILARALDPACLDGEAETSASMFVRHCRREGVTLQLLTTAIVPVRPVQPVPDKRPEACDIRLNFGKHKGCSLSQIAREDPQYLEWAIENLETKPMLASAMKIVAEFYGLEVAA